MVRKPSVASQVVQQARRQTAVIDLEAARPERTTSIRGRNSETNIPFLKALFPDGQQPVEVDLSFLLDFPNLQEPFLEGFRRWGSGVGLSTKQQAACNLANRLFRFLAENELFEIEFAELDRSLFIGFIRWLDRPDGLNVGKPLSIGSRRQALGNVRVLINALLRSNPWGNVARRVRQAIPARPWPGAHLKATPKQQLDLEHMRAIIRAAEAEVEAIKLRFDRREALVRSGQETLKRGRKRGDLASFLAIVAERYPTIIPGLTEMMSVDRALAHEMQGVHTQRGVTQHFYAGSRDLIPFVILILAATAFNAETVLTLEWSNVRPDMRFNLPVVTVIGKKGRADEDQVVLDAETGGFGMTSILATLARITERLRPHLADLRDRERLFVFAQERGTVAAKAYRHPSGLAVSDASLRWSRLRFIKDNALELFTFDQFRTTLLDAAHRWTGDFRVVTSLGRHRRLQTGWLHYTSGGTKARYRERIGETIILRERWHESDGKIDPRGLMLTTNMDRGAATPGFVCLDPYDSPRPNQTKWRLCSAYGECPACPLAGADIGDSAAVAYYLGLRTSVYRAQGRIAPAAWISRWASVVEALDQLLELVPADIRDLAIKLRVELPAVVNRPEIAGGSNS